MRAAESRNRLRLHGNVACAHTSAWQHNVAHMAQGAKFQFHTMPAAALALPALAAKYCGETPSGHFKLILFAVQSRSARRMCE